MTCHQIWHLKWKNGEEQSRPRVGRDIQMRALGKKKRLRKPTQDNTEGEEEPDERAEAQQRRKVA
ncbi:hypothetical protein V7S43_009121 [Phytophthora oleae]|uniref:Uncharacterized protein n=1 Tax=Phytophthora oleae TaxID=2107226 RepID=A0ABD3FFF6_9STRA